MRTQGLVHRRERTEPAPVAVSRVHLVPPLRINLQRIRPMAPDIAWAVFVGLNLVAMRLFDSWATVPFLAIWVSLTVVYGFRLWRLQPTILTWAAVTLATAVLAGRQSPRRKAALLLGAGALLGGLLYLGGNAQAR